jgi:hypothetical protein
MHVVSLRSVPAEQREKMLATLDEMRRAVESGEIETLFALVAGHGEWWYRFRSSSCSIAEIVGLLEIAQFEFISGRENSTDPKPLPGNDSGP